MAKQKQEKSKESDVRDVYNVMTLLGIKQSIDEVHKKFKISGSTTDIKARKGTQVSTGVLMMDILLGGGIFPGGWYTALGVEGSSKSTTMMTIATNMLVSNVPLVRFTDAEGSTSPDYVEKIAASILPPGIEFDIKTLFGIQDNKGNYIIPPRVYLDNDNSLETFYKTTSALLKRLPDKIYIEGEWWLLFERTKQNISKFKGKHNKHIGDPRGKIAIKSPDGGTMQCLILLDSLPTLVTDADDEDEGANSIGLDARGHSKHNKKLRGKLKRKHSTVIAINQLRDAINLTGHGPRDYEPCGNTVKHAADVRVRCTPRAIPHGSGSLEEEQSVQFKGKGVDTYRYIYMRTTKNKFGTPYLETRFRLWQSDPIGVGHGFDIVWDTWEYLLTTGQVEGSMGRKFTIKIDNGEDTLEVKNLKWLDFKKLIVLQGDELKNVCKQFGITKNPRIRQRCFEQMKSGHGIELYFETLHDLNAKDEVELIDWDIDDLIDEAIEYELGSKKELKKLSKKKLVKMIESAYELEEDEEDDE